MSKRKVSKQQSDRIAKQFEQRRQRGIFFPNPEVSTGQSHLAEAGPNHMLPGDEGGAASGA